METESRWLSKRLRDVKWIYIYAAVSTLLSAASFVGFSWCLADYANRWLVEDLIHLPSLLYAFAFVAARYAFAHGASLLNFKAASDIVSNIKDALYPKLLYNNRGDSISDTLLITRISDDLKPYFYGFIPYAISSGIVALVLLTLSFWLEFWVGISLLVSLVVIPFLMSMIGVGAASLHKKHINLFMKYSAVFYNRLHTIAEIVNLNNLKHQFRFLSEKSKALNSATTNVMKIAILSSAVLELFVSIAIAAVAIYLGLSLLGEWSGENEKVGYDFHVALFLLMITPYLFFYLRKFVSAYHDKNKALASAKLLMPILSEEADNSDFQENEDYKTLQINKLNFAYPDTVVKVLNDLDFTFPEKGLVLIKGISGSGKSTLLKILSGSLGIEEGEVSVNGKDNQWSAQWLNDNTSYMNQFPFIFDGTLRYNVFLEQNSDTESPYPDFLDTLISKKENGWDTELSHNGKQFSGGEKQLITLARMMLHPRAVALMDEPTANLDDDTVSIIVEQIKKMSQTKLVILASHNERFESVANTVLHLNWGEQMDYA